MFKARNPTAEVEINGQLAHGLIDCTVDSNSFAQADTFSLTFSVKRLLEDDWYAPLYGSRPTATQKPLVVYNIDPFLVADSLTIKISFSDDYPAVKPKQFILGRTDDVAYDPIQNTVTFTGRDYTGFFIDTKSTDKHVNKTIAQVVTALAKKYGMTAEIGEVTRASKKKIGSYLNQYQAQMTDGRSEWDLLRFLAQSTVDDDGNSYVVYVDGNTLHFEPRRSASDYSLVCQAPTQASESTQFDGQRINFSRNLTVARNIIVVVDVSNLGGKSFSVSYPRSAKGIGAGSATSKQQVVVRTRTGITKEQALKYAQAVQQEMSRHQVKMDASMPADLDLLPSSLIQVSGTNTLFDQAYYADSIKRSLSVSGGFVMSFNAKNNAQESEATL